MKHSATDEQTLVNKIRDLPADKIAEVEDFVDFLRQRERALTTAAAQLSAAAFQRVWDNPDDAEYDRL
jgi:hypothetical protein